MGRLIFITGGVRSGKSAFAEHYVSQLVNETKQTPIYLATGVAFDHEMNDRIARHQQDRKNSELHWITYEVPTAIEQYATVFNDTHILLFECVTTWLSNILYEIEALPPNEQQQVLTAKLTHFKQIMTNWRLQGATALLISNEVLDDGISPYVETAQYQRILGELHQWLVQTSDEAYEVNAQIIERWK